MGHSVDELNGKLKPDMIGSTCFAVHDVIPTLISDWAWLGYSSVCGMYRHGSTAQEKVKKE